MSWLSPKIIITFRLITIVLVVMLFASWLDLLPSTETIDARNRSQLCDAIAVSIVEPLRSNQQDRLDSLVDAIVSRNPEILSIGVRGSDGLLVNTTTEHRKWWRNKDKAVDELSVPLEAGNQIWGEIEFVFESRAEAKNFFGFSNFSWLLIFVSASAGVFFMVYLGTVMKSLSPDKSQNVRKTLDILTEGLLVIDVRGRIAIVNQVFCTITGTQQERVAS